MFSIAASLHLSSVTSLAFSFAVPIVAILPELKFKKSASIPSENIIPFVGINDSITSFVCPAYVFKVNNLSVR